MKTRAAVPLILLAFGAPVLAGAQTITSTSESNPHPGVRIVEGRTSGPTTDFYAAYVSLCSGGVSVDASSYAGYSTSASWGSSVGAELAVNGDFFTSTPRNHVYGDAVGGGTRWATNRSGLDYSADWYYHRYGWLAFGDDEVEFTNTEWVKQNLDSIDGWRPEQVAPPVPPGTRSLVSGFPQLVIDGEPYTCSSPTANSCFPDRTDMRARHPRTAMGLSEDRQTFILVVVDGRSTRSVGMYGAELAKLMHDLGAHTAFNLDGGGSSQMWVRGRGTINRPSDGTPRSVLNHWGVFADGSGLPTHCDNRWDGQVHELHGQNQRTTDLNGDGQGDVCIRTANGIRCSVFENGAFTEVFEGPSGAAFDDPGWSEPSHYASIRWGDIDGDGLADVCGRNNDRIRCWKSTGTGFGEAIEGPDYGDAVGAFRPKYYSTIRLTDFNGDGMDDVCMRWGDGMHCHPSTGVGFGPAVVAAAFTNDNGWDDPSRYGTIRFGDVNGDGMDDVCGRSAADFRCWLSTGDGFGQRIDGPAWSNDNGWGKFRYYSTIRLVDLDDDGRADVCARASDGIRCHLSTGDGFGPAILGPALSDETGWADYSNYSTLRFADVTGDGMLDACARGNAGIRCWPFDGTSFGAAISTEILRDQSGWSNAFYHRSLDFIDLDRDGKADLCARASAGVVCWRSTGTAFEETIIAGPAWSDEAGFNAAPYYSTMTFLGPVRPLPEEPVIVEDMGGEVGADVGAEGGADIGSGPQGAQPDGGGVDFGTRGDAGSPYGGDGPTQVGAKGGCGCTTSGSSAPGGLLLIAMMLLVRPRRRRD